MRNLSAAYKNPRLPLIYEVKMSIDRGATWQDIPTGAELILPFGTAPQRCEDPQPFDYVGPDMGLIARNISGYWTNTSKTGILDLASGEVWLRIRTGNTAAPGEWLPHIQGPISIGSVQTRAGDMVSFTLRGTLNSIDSVFASVVLNQRTFSLSGIVGGTMTRTAGYPNLFKNWLKVQIENSPEGLFCLRWNSRDKTVSWDNGQAVKLTWDNQSGLTLTGFNGGVITCLHGPMNDDIQDDYATEDIEAWIYVGRIIQTGQNPRNYIYMKDAWPTSTLERFKTYLASHINLDIDSLVQNGDPVNIIAPDVAVAHLADQDNFYPASCVGVGEGNWLISSYDGAYKGTWLFSTSQQSFSFSSAVKINDDVNFQMERKGSSVVCFTSGATIEFPTKSFISAWKVSTLTIGSWVRTIQYTSTTDTVAWRSLAAYSVSEYYGVFLTNSNNGQIGQIISSGITKKGLEFKVNGPSLFPACVIMSDTNSLYVVYNAIYNVTDPTVKVEIWAHFWNIDSDAYGLTLLNISSNQQVEYKITPEYTTGNSTYFNPLVPTPTPLRIRIGSTVSHLNTIVGPVMCSSASDGNNTGVASDLPYSSAVLLDTIQHSQPGTDWQNSRHLGGKGRIYVTDFSVNTGSVLTGYTHDFDISHPNISTTYCYTDLINVNVVGSSIKILSGANVGVTRTISAQEIISSYWPGSPTVKYTKLTFNAFAFPVGRNVLFTVGNSGIATDKIITTELNDKNGANLLDKNIGILGFEIFNSRSLNANINKNITYCELAKNRSLGRVICGDLDYDSVGGIDVHSHIAICTRSAFVFVHYSGADTQKPYIIVNEFGNKTTREAIEEVAASWNCRILPREGDGRLVLQRRAYVPTEIMFNIETNQYEYAGQWQPYAQYSKVVVNGVTVGSLIADRFGRTLTINNPQIHPSQCLSLASDIFNSIGNGRRTHKIRTDWMIWIEPGDVGYLKVAAGGTQSSVKVFCIEAEPDLDTKKHTLLLIETPTEA